MSSRSPHWPRARSSEAACISRVRTRLRRSCCRACRSEFPIAPIISNGSLCALVLRAHPDYLETIGPARCRTLAQHAQGAGRLRGSRRARVAASWPGKEGGRKCFAGPDFAIPSTQTRRRKHGNFGGNTCSINRKARSAGPPPSPRIQQSPAISKHLACAARQLRLSGLVMSSRASRACSDKCHKVPVRAAV